MPEVKGRRRNQSRHTMKEQRAAIRMSFVTPHKVIAEQLGVSVSTISSWRTKLQSENPQVFTRLRREALKQAQPDGATAPALCENWIRQSYKYTNKFREEAVLLSLLIGQVAAAEQLQICRSNICKWSQTIRDLRPDFYQAMVRQAEIQQAHEAPAPEPAWNEKLRAKQARPAQAAAGELVSHEEEDDGSLVYKGLVVVLTVATGMAILVIAGLSYSLFF